MNVLLDRLPDSVEICGQAVPIDTNFYTGIIFEEMGVDDDLSDGEKIETALRLYFGDNVRFVGIDAVMEAIDKIMWFYSCGKPKETGNEAEEPGKIVFSYEHDAEYIYQAFMSAYQIDLREEKVHWWKFRALFKALPDTTQFMKIVGYRSVKITSKMSKDEKAFYQKMKRLFALPKDGAHGNSDSKLQAELEEALRNGDTAALMEQIGRR